MPLREKRHPKNNRLIVGAEINDSDSWDLIANHAKAQVQRGEEIGTILVSIQQPKTPNLRWLTYTAFPKSSW